MSQRENLFKNLNGGSITSFTTEFRNVVILREDIFTAEASTIWAAIVGLSLGILFCLSFVQYQKSIKVNGISLSNTFLKLGVLIPMTISLVLWEEYPTNFQWVGIILSLLAILIANINFKKDSIKDIRLNLLLLILYGGLAQFATKLFQKYALIEYKNLLLFFIFLSALLTSLIIIIKNKNRFGLNEFVSGTLVGIPNLFTSYFMVLAFTKMNTSTAVLLNSSGTIVLVLLYGLFIFKEKLLHREKIAIALTILAMITINY
jgi:drug/metabolite transporter (DMT)-like permease